MERVSSVHEPNGFARGPGGHADLRSQCQHGQVQGPRCRRSQNCNSSLEEGTHRGFAQGPGNHADLRPQRQPDTGRSKVQGVEGPKTATAARRKALNAIATAPKDMSPACQCKGDWCCEELVGLGRVATTYQSARSLSVKKEFCKHRCVTKRHSAPNMFSKFSCTGLFVPFGILLPRNLEILFSCMSSLPSTAPRHKNFGW